MNKRFLQSELSLLYPGMQLQEALQEKDGIAVWRTQLPGSGQTAVFKYFEKTVYRREIDCYQLLRQNGIPSIPLLARNDRAILMKDMSVDSQYRMATEEDLRNPDIIKAIARWYREFHGIPVSPALQERMYSEVRLLTPQRLAAVRQMDPDNALFPYLDSAMPALLALASHLPMCLNYNDFYYTNLIVAQDGSAAFLFDYNLMGCGYPYNDIRNVCSALGPEAKEIFLSQYGWKAQKEQEQIMADRWISPLAGLIYASEREKFPGWAQADLEALRTGAIYRAALEYQQRFGNRLHC